jgi:hypothetical protein
VHSQLFLQCVLIACRFCCTHTKVVCRHVLGVEGGWAVEDQGGSHASCQESLGLAADLQAWHSDVKAPLQPATITMLSSPTLSEHSLCRERSKQTHLAFLLPATPPTDHRPRPTGVR